MALVYLNHQSIAAMSLGAAGQIIDAALLKAQNDISDRGKEDGKPRTVTIKIILTHDQKTDKIIGEVETGVSIPPFRTLATVMKERAGRGGECQLMFQDLNPENPDQPTFPQMDQEQE